MLVDLAFLSDIPLYEVEKPYSLFIPVPPGTKTTNCESMIHFGIRLEDARGREHNFDLDTSGFKFIHGFQHVRTRSDAPRPPEPAEVEAYTERVISFLRKELHADCVIFFDWRVSRNYLISRRVT